MAPVAPGSRAVFLALRFSLKRLGSGAVGVLSRLSAATGRRCQPLAGTWAGYRGGGGANGGEDLQIAERRKDYTTFIEKLLISLKAHKQG